MSLVHDDVKFVQVSSSELQCDPRGQGDPKLFIPTFRIRHGKKLKVTRLSSVVAWKVFGYINILRKYEQRGI